MFQTAMEATDEASSVLSRAIVMVETLTLQRASVQRLPVAAMNQLFHENLQLSLVKYPHDVACPQRAATGCQAANSNGRHACKNFRLGLESFNSRLTRQLETFL